MVSNWTNYCNLSLVHFMAFPDMQNGEGQFVQSIQKLEKLKFFNALEMGSINDPNTRIEVCHAAQDCGFKLGFGAQPLILSQGINLNSLEDQIRKDGIEIVKAAIDQAAEIRAESFVLLSGKDPGIEGRSSAYDALADSIWALGKYAKSLGIRLVLEIFDRSVEKCALVGPAVEASEFARKVKVNYPEFGLLYDMGHMPLLDESADEVLPLLREHLAEVHLGNCVKVPGSSAFGDKHPRFDYPGGVNGTKELTQFLHSLFVAGYLKRTEKPAKLPWLGFEVRPQICESTEQILENIQQTWKNAWDQLDFD